MLGERRVSEAEDNVRNCLEEGLLRKAAFEPRVFSILKRNADESLGVANFLSENARPGLWVITAAY